VAVREAMAFSFAPFNGALKRSERRSQQNRDDFSPGRAQLHEISIPPTRCLVQEPRAALGFIDPNFDQARGGKVTMLIAHVVCLAKVSS
jgi:hypothetical protein